jgi:AAA+ ATPase superfamily predicted ATPase
MLIRMQARLFQNKAIILLGPRQSGKITLVNAILEKTGEKYLLLNADEPDVRELFPGATSTRSSSFDLNAGINEPLTGRKFEFTLYSHQKTCTA